MDSQKPQYRVFDGVRHHRELIFYVNTTANSKREAERYNALQLAGRVAKILSNSRGIQKVKLATGETQALALTAAGQQYQVGEPGVRVSPTPPSSL